MDRPFGSLRGQEIDNISEWIRVTDYVHFRAMKVAIPREPEGNSLILTFPLFACRLLANLFQLCPSCPLYRSLDHLYLLAIPWRAYHDLAGDSGYEGPWNINPRIQVGESS
jgi:hypothetical protein